MEQKANLNFIVKFKSWNINVSKEKDTFKPFLNVLMLTLFNVALRMWRFIFIFSYLNISFF